MLDGFKAHMLKCDLHISHSNESILITPKLQTHMSVLPLSLIFYTARAENSCSLPVVVRKIVPSEGSTDMPVNSAVLVSLIGDGNEDHMVLSLRELIGGQTVEGDLESSCYAHESNTEAHCTLFFQPTAPLTENTQYQVTLNGTELHAEDSFSYSSVFTTGFDSWSMNKPAPELKIKQYVERNPEAVEECDWTGAMKYDLTAENLQIDTDRHLVILVYEVNPITCDETVVHTLFPHLWHRSFEFRQVLEPGSEGPRCYRIEQQDWAGNRSPSSLTKCWNPIEHHEEVFWGCSNEPDDPVAVEEQDDPPDTSPPESTEVVNPSKQTSSSGSDSGCSHFASFMLVPVLLWRKRSKHGD